jgi:hypothetical protein
MNIVAAARHTATMHCRTVMTTSNRHVIATISRSSMNH